MELIFEKMYTPTTNDFDRYDVLNPCSILDICQSIAGVHADEMKIGFKDCFPKGIIWILARSKYEVIENPSIDEELKVVTWPKTPTRVDMDREVEIKSKNGDKTYIKSIHKWVLFDYKKWQILPTSVLTIDGEYVKNTLFSDKFRPLPKFDINEEKYNFVVKQSQIDHNMHMNNTKYAEEIINALKLTKEEKIKTFEINFLQQCMLDEQLNINYVKNGKEINIEIKNKEGNVVTRAQITLF